MLKSSLAIVSQEPTVHVQRYTASCRRIYVHITIQVEVKIAHGVFIKKDIF
jgi:hypothetical protein